MRSVHRVSAVIVLALGGLFAVVPAPADVKPARRAVYLVGGLKDSEWIACSAAVAAADPSAVLLADSAKTAEVNSAFLAAYRPDVVIPVGDVKGGGARLGVKVRPRIPWDDTVPAELVREASHVVVCPASPRRLLLHAAGLAGALRAPLLLIRGGETGAGLPGRLAAWKAKTVYAIGTAAALCQDLDGVRVVAAADEDAVARLHAAQLSRDGPVRTVVVANAADVRLGRGRMSLLAPWLAVQKRAALALTNETGTDVEAAVRAALRRPGVEPDHLLLCGTLRAIPTERRPNPAQGKDAEIEMEPLTPRGEEPFTFATGRLFHADPGVALVQLARGRLLEGGPRPRRALVVSNPGGGLPLLETFSRHTARELANAGYKTTAWFHDEVMKEAVRRAVPRQDIFLWEGHYRTLIDEFGFLTWDEPLPPALIFLQSCLALKEDEAGPLVRRGAVAVVGSSTRTYSGTGGAFTLAYFNALLYDDQSLGGALRQAKNFLLCYSLLKEQRLGENAKLTGVNQRSSWAFTLWGDPTLHLPPAEPPADRLDGVRLDAKGERLTLVLPDTAYPPVKVGRYEATMRPNGRLAGLLRPGEGEDDRRLVPFVFAEVPLPQAPRGRVPRLRTRLPPRNYVFCWDARRRTGYLLVTPRARDEGEIGFRVEWEE